MIIKFLKEYHIFGLGRNLNIIKAHAILNFDFARINPKYFA